MGEKGRAEVVGNIYDEASPVTWVNHIKKEDGDLATYLGEPIRKPYSEHSS